VQAGQIYDEILRLRKIYPDKPVYAVAVDVCASGGYYIAAAAQEIYADKASIVGSIGVRADSFGFVEAMNKLGIERRLYTAGANKAMLDPFVPEDPIAISHLQTMLGAIHQQFIDAVKSGRGERLKDDAQLFTGLVWTGEESARLGLIDGLGSTRYVAEQVIGAEDMVDYTLRSNWIDRILTRVELSFGQGLQRVLSEQPVLR
jgi:protease-4